MNKLLFGDNLKWLREKKIFPDESVDMVYLDPPFNSNADYNVLFREDSGEASQAQFHAFTDTWNWADAALTYAEFVDTCENNAVVDMVEALHSFLKNSPMMAYLAMMAPRLVELHRILKPSGCLYLHCDPTASHYLRILLDGIFGAVNFRNEIIWRRSGSHNSAKRNGPIHDTIFFYAKTRGYIWNKIYRPYLKGYVKAFFNDEDEKGKFRSQTLTGSGTRKGDSGKIWRGFNPTEKGRHWAFPGTLAEELGIEHFSQHEKLDFLADNGFLAKTVDGLPEYRQYLQTSKGVLTQDIWAYQPYTNGCLQGTEDCIDQDVKWLEKRGGGERLGYDTQKPQALLERIILASTNPGGLVVDPFCGCGTTVHAVEKTGRQWIGIDVTYIAINLIKTRIKDAFGADVQFEERGQPTDFESAKALAALDRETHRNDFEHWALSLIEARPMKEGDGKGADRGVDGILRFNEYEKSDKKISKAAKNREPIRRKILVQVKGGHVERGDITKLLGDVNNQKFAAGVFITLEKPTRPMREEAADAGRYTVNLWDEEKSYPKIQILTVEGLMNKTERLDAPPLARTFAKAEREATGGEQQRLV
jgi:site-specific DNA-methyltransferase (adenine-specific)